MSFLRCLRYVNPNQLSIGNSFCSITSRIVGNNPICVQNNRLPSLLQSLNSNQQSLSCSFEQRRYARFPTVKKRLTHKRNWWVKKTPKINHNATLSLSNKNFIQEIYKAEYSSPLNVVKIESKTWTPQSKRTGLIARKIGVQPIWLKTGEKILCTLLQFVDNHVINSQSIEETKQNTIYQRRWLTHDYATIVVGAESGDVTKYTKDYCSLFSKAGVPPKQRLTKMIITEDAMLPPGTPLYMQHFKIGQYVDVFGRTIDHGFQGVVRRWGFKGDGRKHHGATKTHRRVGSIGQSRKSGGPMKGRKMPGHMGDARKTFRSMQVMRMNTKYNVMWVKGQGSPGLVNSFLYVFDAMCEGRGFQANDPPPFPTYIPAANEEMPENIYHPDVFVMDSESITYPKVEEVKRRSGAKTAKIRKSK